jgi:hypothetical protein
MESDSALLIEENLISLRLGVVQSDGFLTYLCLLEDLAFAASLSTNSRHRMRLVYLFRNDPIDPTLKPPSEREEAYTTDLIPFRMNPPPTFQLIWGDSGHSVAVAVNGEPWAFIHEERNHGYSKGIVRPTIGNVWEQELFEQTFGPFPK